MAKTAYFAKSLAGHDKGTIYVIMAEQDAYIYLSDGRYHPIDKPKKKNRKHVQLIGFCPKEMAAESWNKKQMRDEDIRRVIKQYCAEMKSGRLNKETE